MHQLARRWPVLLTLLALLAAPGCAMFRSLNLTHLNRGPAMDVGDAYFSVSDPEATLPRGAAD